MLSTLIRRTTALAEDTTQQRRTQSQDQIVRTRTGQINVISAAWCPLYAVYLHLKRRQICPRISLAHAAVCKQSLSRIQESLLAPSDETEGEALFFGRFATEFRSQLQTALSQVWKSYVTRRVQTTTGERLLEQFRYGDHIQTVDRINSLLAEISRLSETLPGGVQDRFDERRIEPDIELVEQKLTELRRLVHELPDSALPEEVRIFLDVANGPGAKIELYTETVAIWLERHGYRDRLRLRLER